MSTFTQTFEPPHACELSWANRDRVTSLTLHRAVLDWLVAIIRRGPPPVPTYRADARHALTVTTDRSGVLVRLHGRPGWFVFMIWEQAKKIRSWPGSSSAPASPPPPPSPARTPHTLEKSHVYQ